MPRKMMETVLELSGGIFINPKILNRFENSSKLRKIQKPFKKAFLLTFGKLDCSIVLRPLLTSVQLLRTELLYRS